MSGLLFTVALLASAAEPASISFDQDPIVLGRTEAATATILAEETPGTEDRPLRVSVNVGAFGEVKRVAPGRYEAVYRPPETRFPQFAFVAVGRELGPDAPIEFLRVPLFGATRLPVDTRAGSEVSVEVAGRTYGPVKASARGHATVPILVPPGVREGLIVAKDVKGVVTQRKVLVGDNAYNRLTAHVVPHAVVANGRDRARLEVSYDLEREVAPAELAVTVSEGQLTFESRVGNRFVYGYVAPVTSAAKTARFSVTVATDKAAHATTGVDLGLPDPSRVVVRPPAKAVPARSSAPFSLLVLDSEGLGVPAARVSVTCDGRPLASPTFVGAGVYEATLVTPDAYPASGTVELRATVEGGSGRPVEGVATYRLEPPRTLTAQLFPDPVPADGATEAQLTLELRDGTGAPVTGAHLTLAPSHGQLRASTELGQGLYRATWIPPTSIPPEGVTVTVADGVSLKQPVHLRLRPRLRHFFLGVRGGVAHSLTDLFTGRVGLEAYAPQRLFGRPVGLGLSATYSQVSRQVFDDEGDFSERVDASFVVAALRLSVEVISGERLSANAGLGPVLHWSLFRTSSGARSSRLGPGALGFVGLTLELGPGQALADLSYTWAPSPSGDLRLQAGGLGLEVGYRLALF